MPGNYTRLPRLRRSSMLCPLMKEASKYNIRYVGFESLADGARRLDYAITASGASARYASIHIPVAAFGGPGRVTFQDAATICYEKIRSELEGQLEAQVEESMAMTLAPEDIERFRPRRRAAGK